MFESLNLNCNTRHNEAIFLTFICSEQLLKASIKSHTKIRERLLLWNHLIKMSKDALIALSKNLLRHFDPIGGEGRCELRAFKLVQILNDSIKRKKLKDNLPQVIESLKKIENASLLLSLKPISENLLNKNLEQIIRFYKLNIEIDENIFHFIISFGLTIVKERGFDGIDRTNYKLLPKHYNHISLVPAKKLVKSWQPLLTALTIQFMQEQSNYLNQANHYLKKYFYSPYILTDNDCRLCSSTSMGIRLITFIFLLNNTSKIVFKINFLDEKKELLKEMNLFFVIGNEGKLSYSLDSNDIDDYESLFVVEGCSVISSNSPANEIEKAITSIVALGALNVILANALNKSEFPGVNRSIKLDIKEPHIIAQNEYLKSLKGFSLEDPSIFCITHISALTLKELESYSDSPTSINLLPKLKTKALA